MDDGGGGREGQCAQALEEMDEKDDMVGGG